MSKKEIISNIEPDSAIDRAVGNSREIIDSKIVAVDIRVNGIEKAIEVFQADLTRVPTQLDRAITGLRDLLQSQLENIGINLVGIHKVQDRRESDITAQVNHAKDLMKERFLGVAAQFSERDTRTDQRAGDTKLAVDAAFAAAKEATAKIEAGFTKQIDAMVNIIDTKTSNLNSGLADLKERLTIIEARTAGISSANFENKATNQDNSARIFSVIAIVASVLIGAGEIWGAVERNERNQVVAESVQKLQTEQTSLARTSARNPVERTDLDVMSQRLDALSNRLNSEKK